jgi:hypothetical protein
MSDHKAKTPSQNCNPDDRDVELLATLANLLLEHASYVGEGHFRYLYFGLQLKEWIYFSEIESYPSDILMLANGHLNVWVSLAFALSLLHIFISESLLLHLLLAYAFLLLSLSQYFNFCIFLYCIALISPQW